MTRVQTFKHQLANVFDNDLRTKQWQNGGDIAVYSSSCVELYSDRGCYIRRI